MALNETFGAFLHARRTTDSPVPDGRVPSPIASTNDHRKVDQAARRSSRCDTVIRMEPPNLEGRLAILERYLAWCDAALDLDAVARATDRATGADLKELVRATVLHTADNVTTEALLAQAATGRWRTEEPAAGQYL